MGFVACLKQYDPRRGCVARSYAHAGMNLRFAEGIPVRGLTEAQAEALRKIRQPGKGKEALLDIYSDEEWDDFLARQAAAKLGLPAPIAARAMQQAPPSAQNAVAVDTLAHTDLNGVRVQHTQEAAEPAAAEAAPSKGPKKRSGGR